MGKKYQHIDTKRIHAGTAGTPSSRHSGACPFSSLPCSNTGRATMTSNTSG